MSVKVDEVPDELWIMIFGQCLDPLDLVAAALTCRRWHDLIRDHTSHSANHLWQRIATATFCFRSRARDHDALDQDAAISSYSSRLADASPGPLSRKRPRRQPNPRPQHNATNPNPDPDLITASVVNPADVVHRSEAAAAAWMSRHRPRTIRSREEDEAKENNGGLGGRCSLPSFPTQNDHDHTKSMMYVLSTREVDPTAPVPTTTTTTATRINGVALHFPRVLGPLDLDHRQPTYYPHVHWRASVATLYPLHRRAARQRYAAALLRSERNVTRIRKDLYKVREDYALATRVIQTLREELSQLQRHVSGSRNGGDGANTLASSTSMNAITPARSRSTPILTDKPSMSSTWTLLEVHAHHARLSRIHADAFAVGDVTSFATRVGRVGGRTVTEALARLENTLGVQRLELDRARRLREKFELGLVEAVAARERVRGSFVPRRWGLEKENPGDRLGAEGSRPASTRHCVGAAALEAARQL